MASLHVTPSTLEVDYDKNLTDLYQAITDQKWEQAVKLCKSHPEQAATWVVRRYEEDDEIMWRFLPIHSACARQPPSSVITALLRAYPDGAKCIDDQGMYALHYACGNQASRDVIRQLLVNFPEAATLKDPRGMLPIHYLACWGPSSVSVVDMLLVAHRDVANAKDDEGNTPMDLAKEGDYPERNAVIAALKKWINELGAGSSGKSKMYKNKMESLEEGEEKKEDDDDDRRQRRPVSPTEVKHLEEQVRMLSSRLNDQNNSSEVGRLKNEIRHLEEELDYKDIEVSEVETERDILTETWKHKYEDSEFMHKHDERSFQKKYYELEKRTEERNKIVVKEMNRLREQLKEARHDLFMTKASLEDRSKSTSEKDTEIEDLRRKLETSRSERDGLRATLGDLMEQHDNYKKKSTQLVDRLGSLAASLESMIDQQKKLSNSMKKRSSQYKDVLKKRQEKLKEIELLEKSMEGDDDNLESSLDKQMKEMECIAAVIAAARE